MSSHMEKSISLAAKLYNCRDTAKKLYGDEYKSKMLEWQHFIKDARSKHKLKDDLAGAMKLIEDCVGIDGSGSATMNILAAYVELIEPSV